jgi:preprotein translocase subunit SecG
MYGIILFFHIIICVLLIIVVLLQQTRGGGLSSVFGGGGGTESLFGGKGATPFFVKLTSGLAVAFFVTSITLVLLSRRPTLKSAVERGLEELPTQPSAIPQEGSGEMPGEIPMIPEESPSGGE